MIVIPTFGFGVAAKQDGSKDLHIQIPPGLTVVLPFTEENAKELSLKLGSSLVVPEANGKGVDIKDLRNPNA